MADPFPIGQAYRNIFCHPITDLVHAISIESNDDLARVVPCCITRKACAIGIRNGHATTGEILRMPRATSGTYSEERTIESGRLQVAEESSGEISVDEDDAYNANEDSAVVQCLNRGETRPTSGCWFRDRAER